MPRPPIVRFMRGLAFGVVAFVVIVVVILVLLTGQPSNPMSVEAVRAKVEKGVPLGADRREVEAWLDAEGIGHGYVGERLQYSSAARDSDVPPGESGGYIEAIIRDTARSPMVQWDIRLLFFFDKQGKLVNRKVEPVGTGP